uniref:Uncharacterized protein n=1 Tax=Avena sativa TaxID=4498 RepID=A0ACD5Z867_AVESA
MANNGVKVTYIETQFVTSDAASFKSLVQRLTGKSTQATEPARQLHRPRPSRPGADGRSTVTGTGSYYMSTGTAVGPAASTAADGVHGLCDYPELLHVVGATERGRGGNYSDLLY